MVFVFLFSVLFSQQTFAEYRVFVLEITNNKTKNSYTVKSTLDPDQYRSVYLLTTDESIAYVDTWKCWGNTSGLKALCEAPPRAPAEADMPAVVPAQ